MHGRLERRWSFGRERGGVRAGAGALWAALTEWCWLCVAGRRGKQSAAQRWRAGVAVGSSDQSGHARRWISGLRRVQGGHDDVQAGQGWALGAATGGEDEGRAGLDERARLVGE